LNTETYLILDDKVERIKSRKQLLPEYAHQRIPCAEVYYQDKDIKLIAINYCHVSPEGILTPENDAAEIFDMALDGVKNEIEPDVVQKLFNVLKYRPNSCLNFVTSY
jgi:hypothetical protein